MENAQKILELESVLIEMQSLMKVYKSAKLAFTDRKSGRGDKFRARVYGVVLDEVTMCCGDMDTIFYGDGQNEKDDESEAVEPGRQVDHDWEEG